MRALGLVVLIVLALALGVAAVIFGAHVVAWNINDIAEKGANFWNVLWILLVAIALVGGSTKATS